MYTTCEECFESRQVHIGKCPECGKQSYKTYITGIAFIGECTECGYWIGTAGGFPPPCTTDKTDYLLTIIKPGKERMVKLAKLLCVNTVQLHQMFDEANEKITFQYNAADLYSMCAKLTAMGIDYQYEEQLNEVYPHYWNCPYDK